MAASSVFTVWDSCEEARDKVSFISDYENNIDINNIISNNLFKKLIKEKIFYIEELPLSELLCRIRAIAFYSPAVAHSLLVHSTAWLAAGKNLEGILALSITEPHGGTDIKSSLKTWAEEGDKTRITGEKIFTTNAPYASYFIVLANSPHGPTLYAVPKSSSIKYTVLDLIGLRGTGASHVIFNNAEAFRISEYGAGIKNALKGITLGRLGYSAIALGIADRALSIIAAAAFSKEIFGRRLSEYQGIRWRVSEIYSKLVMIESLIYKIINESNNLFIDPLKASIAKNEGTRLAQEASWQASQILGGRGLERWTATDRMMRDARALDIGEGAREVLLDFIGTKALKKYHNK